MSNVDQSYSIGRAVKAQASIYKCSLDIAVIVRLIKGMYVDEDQDKIRS